MIPSIDYSRKGRVALKPRVEKLRIHLQDQYDNMQIYNGNERAFEAWAHDLKGRRSEREKRTYSCFDAEEVQLCDVCYLRFVCDFIIDAIVHLYQINGCR